MTKAAGRPSARKGTSGTSDGGPRPGAGLVGRRKVRYYLSKDGLAARVVVTRADFQKLADERIADAKALLAAKRWAAAYYLAGYAVECGLKACVLVRVTAVAEVIFEDRRYSEKCWTHSLTQLVDLA